MPSGTLESPLSTSQERALARSPMLHQDAKKTVFGKAMFGRFHLVHANTAMHDLLSS